MSPDTARLFDATVATYHELEPWYEHLYARLHAILRTELPSVPSAWRPRGPRRASASSTAAEAREAAEPGVGSRGRALDAGCGTGFQTAILRELGWEAHGVDLAAALLARARVDAPGCVYVRGTLERLPYADGCFDAVSTLGSTLSLVDEAAAALAELARVLRPGGRLLLEVEHRPSLDLAWAAASCLFGDPLGYGARLREVLGALTGRTAAIDYPLALDHGQQLGDLTGRQLGDTAGRRGAMRLRLLRRGELARLLSAAGLEPVRWWGLHSATNVLPSTTLHAPTLSPRLAALYRALCRADRALETTPPGRWLCNSLVALCVRA